MSGLLEAFPLAELRHELAKGKKFSMVLSADLRFALDKVVKELFRRNGVALHCLGRTKAGQPKHPLYLAKNTEIELL